MSSFLRLSQAVAGCALILGACSSSFEVVNKPGTATGARLESERVLRAGAARVDITPPPGIPMGGFGPSGRVGRGVWTPLYARATYISDADGNELVFVACDLWSMGGALADRVAERVRETIGTLDRGELIIAATHTHHSPGHFSSYVFYNNHASVDEGYDCELADFLVDRIAQAVIDAHGRKANAVAYYSTKAVSGLARNRSWDPFLMNRESEAIIGENCAIPSDPIRPYDMDPDVYRALDPMLRTIRIDRIDDRTRPIAVLAFASVHPTAMGPSLEVYSGDIFGLAAITCDQVYGSAPHPNRYPPVVSIFNGTEGDVSPNWYRQDRRNALRLARLLANSIIDAAEGGSGNEINGTINGSFDRIGMQDRQITDLDGALTLVANDDRDDLLRAHWTASLPNIGVAAVGGAEDGRSTYAELGSVEGVTDRRLPRVGSKEIELRLNTVTRPFNKIVNALGQLEPDDLPKMIPLGLYRWGGLTFATVPGEPTTVVGRRIRKRLAAGDNARYDSSMIVSMANEYLSYFSTPEEYDLQHYEGASTIYGPASAPLIELELERLARRTPTGVERLYKEPVSYQPGKEEIFAIDHVGAAPWTTKDGLFNLVQDIGTGRPGHQFPQYIWTSPIAGRFPTKGASGDATLNPQITIECRSEIKPSEFVWQPVISTPIATSGPASFAIENSRGLNVPLIALDADHSAVKWCAIWMREKLDMNVTYRFRIDEVGKPPMYSAEFTSVTIDADPIVPPPPPGVDQDRDFVTALQIPEEEPQSHHFFGVGYELSPDVSFSSTLHELDDALGTGEPIPIVLRHGAVIMLRLDRPLLDRWFFEVAWGRGAARASSTAVIDGANFDRSVVYDDDGVHVGFGYDLLQARGISLYLAGTIGWREYSVAFGQASSARDRVDESSETRSLAGERERFDRGLDAQTTLKASALPVSGGLAFTCNGRYAQFRIGVSANYGLVVRGWQTASGVCYEDLGTPAGFSVGARIGATLGLFVP